MCYSSDDHCALIRSKSSVLQKNEFQKEIPKYLPQITGVLQDVDRQMLLVFRTNDLMRGIEHTLKTHAR